MNAAHATALMQQQQQGMMSLPTSLAAEMAGSNNKSRMPGLPPTPPPRAADFVSMDVDPAAARKAHRRSRSDVPFGYFTPATSSLPPPKVEAGCWGGQGDADDLFNVYLNLEGLDGLSNNNNSSGSSIKTNGADSSDNENDSDDDSRAAGISLKSGAPSGGEPVMAWHARSLSMDSLIGKFNFSAAGGSSAANGIMPGPNRFSLEFGSGEFTPAEMKKIMADERLAEMALADPKRVKRYTTFFSSSFPPRNEFASFCNLPFTSICPAIDYNVCYGNGMGKAN
jgi:hypothetical protein